MENNKSSDKIYKNVELCFSKKYFTKFKTTCSYHPYSIRIHQENHSVKVHIHIYNVYRVHQSAR